MRHFILLLIALLFVACSKQENPIETKKEKSNQVALIFHKPIRNGFKSHPKMGEIGFMRTKKGDEIQYIDDHLIQQRLSFDWEAEWDTVILKSRRDYLEVRLMYRGVDDLDYLFQNGDSVLFEYTDHKPIASILNRPEESPVTNFALYVRDSISSSEYPANRIAGAPLILMHRQEESELPLLNFFDSVKYKAITDIPLELTQEIELLKSLNSSGQMSDQVLQYRVENSLRKLQNLAVGLGADKDKEAGAYQAILDEIQRLENQFPLVESQRNDSLLANAAYRAYLSNSVRVEFRDKVKMLEFNGKGAGRRTVDYPRKYDSIRVSTHMSPLEKKVAQFAATEAILSQPGIFPIEERLKYLTRFKNDFQDSTMVNTLMSRYDVQFIIDDEIKLVGTNGEETTLNALIDKHAGKIIYVDYWASWCGPCIKEMPYSRALQNAEINREVVYIYLSKDKKGSSWKNAIRNLGLEVGRNYRITNAQNSIGFEEMGILFIPRYMVYDRNGKLVNTDAPRPSDSLALKAELAKYL